MNGYMGEYGEGFLGIGYSQPSVNGTGPGANEANPNTASGDNSSNYYQYGTENSSQPVFVAAQRYEGNTIPAEPQIPYQQEQEQEQLEKDAEVARSKAQDILRNILHGIDAGNSSENPQVSAEHNQTKHNSGPTATNNSFENHCNNYYGPQEGFTNTAHGPASTTEIAKIPTPSSSSVETDAQAARLKAMDILRKFQSQPNGNGSVDATGATTDRNSADQSMAQSSSVSYYGPQETQSTGNDRQGVHLIPQQQQENQQYYSRQPVPSQAQLQSPIASSVIPLAIPKDVPAVVPIPTTPPWELAKRRRESLEKDEERKQRALSKNLQYVARLEEERLAQQLQEVQQVKTLEQQIDERYQQKINYRMMKRNNINNGSNNINTSGAGIGTKQRRKAEAKRQKTALPPSLRKQHAKGNHGGNKNNRSGKNGSDSVAIYVSNLPTDGSFDEATIQGLFSAYGSLRKVHFYTDKVTGKRKGDALVIYSLTEEQDEILFAESVCSQVNGCELPGGNVLRVEPSDPYHKITAKTSKSSSQKEKIQQQTQSSSSASASASAVKTGKMSSGGGSIEDICDQTAGNKVDNQPEESGGGENEEGDLDDFFASLE